MENITDYILISETFPNYCAWLDGPLWKPYMFNCRTNEEILVCLKYCLECVSNHTHLGRYSTYERTLEKSLDGDMTKLSAEFDQEIKCCIFWSSSIL